MSSRINLSKEALVAMLALAETENHQLRMIAVREPQVVHRKYHDGGYYTWRAYHLAGMDGGYVTCTYKPGRSAQIPSIVYLDTLWNLNKKVLGEAGAGSDSWFYYTGGSHAANLFSQRQQQLIAPPVLSTAQNAPGR